jgi:hypothetical protein
MANSKKADSNHGASASIEQRILLPFDWKDRSRTLVQIPNKGFYQFGHAINGPDIRIALPNSELDYLAENTDEDWFLTTTFLFPARASEDISSCYPIRRNQCLLVSFDDVEEATLFALRSRNGRILPKNWWLEFEDVDYEKHAKFSSVETSSMGLVRLDGIQHDIGYSAELSVARPARGKKKKPKCEIISVGKLVHETWCRKVDHVCNH